MSAPKLPMVVHVRIDKKAMWLAIGFSVVGLLLSALSLSITARLPKPPLVISVSIKSLLDDYMVSTLGARISPQEAERRTAEYVASIENAIADLSQDESLIIIASEAVLGPNVPDFTDDLKLMAQERAAFLASERGVTLEPLSSQANVSDLIAKMEADTQSLQRDLERLQSGSPEGQGSVQ